MLLNNKINFSQHLSPDLLEKANKLAGISSAILSVLFLFKSKQKNFQISDRVGFVKVTIFSN